MTSKLPLLQVTRPVQFAFAFATLLVGAYFDEGILVSASCVCGGVARSNRMWRSEVLLARTPLDCLATLSACACAAAVCCGAVCMCCWLDRHVAICTCLQCCSISVACCMCIYCCLETVSTSCLHVLFGRLVCLSSPAHGVFFFLPQRVLLAEW